VTSSGMTPVPINEKVLVTEDDHGGWVQLRGYDGT
jgi:hypothetical protein